MEESSSLKWRGVSLWWSRIASHSLEEYLLVLRGVEFPLEMEKTISLWRGVSLWWTRVSPYSGEEYLVGGQDVLSFELIYVSNLLLKTVLWLQMFLL